jgi:hypothetical protein
MSLSRGPGPAVKASIIPVLPPFEPQGARALPDTTISCAGQRRDTRYEPTEADAAAIFR